MISTATAIRLFDWLEKGAIFLLWACIPALPIYALYIGDSTLATWHLLGWLLLANAALLCVLGVMLVAGRIFLGHWPRTDG